MRPPEQFETPGERDDSVNLLDYAIVLAKRSRAIVFTSMAVALLTLVISFFIHNQYTSTARLFPPHQNMTLSSQLVSFLGMSDPTGGVGVGGGLGNIAAGVLGLKSPSDLYVGILTGNTIFDNIIERFNLREVYGGKFIETVRQELAAHTQIGSGKEGLIVIEVTDKDPKRAAEMANAFVEELNKLLQRVSENEAREHLTFLENERQQTSVKLTSAEEALRTFSEKTNVLQIDTQTRGMLEYIASIRAAIDTREVQIQVLRQQTTPQNYDFKLLQTEIKTLKEKLKAAESQIDPDCLGDFCIPTSKVPTLGLDYFRLLREVKYQEALFQLFTRLVEIARLDSVRQASVINIVDQAKPAEKKSKPKRLTTSIAMGVVTFFLMIAWAFIREGWKKLKQSDDSESLALIKHYLDDWKRYFQPITRFFRRRK